MKMAIEIEFKETANGYMQIQFMNWLQTNAKQYGESDVVKIHNGFGGLWKISYTIQGKSKAEANKYVYENFYKTFKHNLVKSVTLKDDN
jgi:hypothetical protein